MPAVAERNCQWSGGICDVRSRPEQLHSSRDPPQNLQDSQPGRGCHGICQRNSRSGALCPGLSRASSLDDLHFPLPGIGSQGEPRSRRLPRSTRNRIGSGMGDHGRRFRPIPGTALEKTAPTYALTRQVSSARLTVVLPRDHSLQCVQRRNNWDGGFLLHTNSTWQRLFDSIDCRAGREKLGGCETDWDPA